MIPSYASSLRRIKLRQVFALTMALLVGESAQQDCTTTPLTIVEVNDPFPDLTIQYVAEGGTLLPWDLSVLVQYDQSLGCGPLSMSFSENGAPITATFI